MLERFVVGRWPVTFETGPFTSSPYSEYDKRSRRCKSMTHTIRMIVLLVGTPAEHNSRTCRQIEAQGSDRCGWAPAQGLWDYVKKLRLPPFHSLWGRLPCAVRLWVLPLRRGSSEGLPAALTRRRDFNVLPIFGCILVESTRCLSHWGQGPKYPLGTLWTHWEHRQHVTPICPVIKCWVHFEYTPLCDPDMSSGYILSTFWMCPAMWLQCTQWAKNWAHFQYSVKCNHNVPSGQMVNIFKISSPIKFKCNHEPSADHI